MRGIADKWQAYPKSRCNSAKQCIDMVKSLPARHVYIDVNIELLSKSIENIWFTFCCYVKQALIALKANIAEDYRKTKQCKLTIAGGRCLATRNLGWGLVKKSPHLEDFNRGYTCTCT